LQHLLQAERCELSAPMKGRRFLNGPSTYPDTSLRGHIRQTINERWSVQGAVVSTPLILTLSRAGKPDSQTC
jgi:hypothetical protein